MDFCFLGPIEVREGGRVIPIGRKKQLAVLAMLVLDAGKVVSTDRLLDELWGEMPPRTAKGSLHNCVSLLRRALGPDVLRTRAPGYVLDVDPGSVDVVRFERLVEEARSADEITRAAKLREALSLWRGPALADIAFEQFAQGTIQRLEEERLSALEDRIDADLALGREGDVIGELERLAANHPLRERLRAQLMLALYRSGRQAEALEVYQDTRRALVDELGIEPSSALRELEQAILRQDPALEHPRAATRASALPEPQELRKTATVLYAELASAGADEGDAEAVHRASVRASHELRVAIEYHGGTIERLTGDEVMAAFGVPTAHEDDVVRAARAAIQLQQSLASVGKDEDGPAIEPRTVIASGEVSVVGGALRSDLTGAVIGFARRLAEAALPGEILVDAATVDRGSERLQTDLPEPRSVRGRREPVSVARLLAVEEAPAGQSDAGPFVGRVGELARVRVAYEQAVSEPGCVVSLVTGEPGIGKSRLVSEFIQSIRGESTVLTGRCVAYGEGATFLPLADIVAQASAGKPAGWIGDLVRGDEDADLLARRIADLVDPDRAAEVPIGEAFWAVRRFLERVAADRPVVVVLEDAQWAEPTLLDLVEYLGRWSREAPIVLVCVARPELREDRPMRGVTSIELAPLARAEASELVDTVGHGIGAEERTRVAELAEGNPLFTEQLVAYVSEKGAGSLDMVPPSLEALLSSRLDRLEPAERAVLQRASVLGREFWHGAVLHLSPRLDVPSVGRLLQELTRKGLVEPGDSALRRADAFRFHHLLIRDVAYQSIPGELRAELHEQAADWLELEAPGLDELVGYHLEQAYRSRAELAPADRRARRLAADAGDRLAAAGLRAAKSGDNPAASNLLARAASLHTPDETARRDLLPELGIVTWRGGDVEAAREVFARALEVAAAASDRRAELRAQLELANLRLVCVPEGGADEFLSVSAKAIPVLEELGDSRTLGRAWYALSFLHGGLRCRYKQSSEAASQAADYYRDAGWSVAPCLQELAAGLYYGPTSVRDAVARCRTLLQQADRGGEANVLAFSAGLEAMAGRFTEARALATRARTIYEELAWNVYIWTNHATVLADIELLAGESGAAESLLTESCRTLDSWGEHGHLATQAAQLGEAVYRRDRYDDAARWAEVAHTHASADDAGAQFMSRGLRAKILARAQEFEEAEDLAQTAVALAAQTDALNQHAHVLLDLAEVFRIQGRAQEASDAIEAAVALFERKGNVVSARAARASIRELAPA